MANTADETALLKQIDGPTMWRHLEYLSSIDRTSGSSGEAAAIDYLVDELRAYGCEVRVHEFDAYLSYPRWARLLTPGLGGGEMAAKTRAFSASTGPAGVSGEVVYVPGSSDMFTDTATVERLRQLDLRGKVVLSEGGGRQNMITARRLGAVAYIHMWPSGEDVIHEGIVTPVWGTPTPGTIDTLPGIPVIAVKQADGIALREAAAHGPVVVTVATETETRWHRLRLPEAIVRGQSDDFVLIAGHIDSWHLGATDNATGNVSCLELARFFQANRGRLLRGVRIAWWPGHSTGRYAGSTWYCDAHWQELHDHCVTYINIDSPGCLGANDYSLVTAVAENGAFARKVVADVTGQAAEIERPVRAGDQSFWGPGVTSLFMLLSNRPKGQRAAVGGSGYGWWWHTEEDTLDKCDGEVLVRDTRIYALAAWRLCTMPLLPHEMLPLARELRNRVAMLQAGAGETLDLDKLAAAGERLVEAAATFDARTAQARATGGEGACAGPLNQAMLDAVRVLTPVNYSAAPPHEHGPATPTGILPALEQAAALGVMDQSSDAARFLRTELTRSANAVCQAFTVAERALRHA